jgi:hypothetical protein
MQGILSGELRAALHAWPPGQPPSVEFVTLVARQEGATQLGPFLWMALGEKERALEALESYRGREFGERTTIWAPLLEPLIEEPLLQEVLRKSNLEGRRPRRAAP